MPCLVKSASAKGAGSWNLYAAVEGGGGTHSTIKGSLNAGWNDRHSIAIGIAWQYQDSRSAPSDYLDHVHEPFFGGTHVPVDYLYVYSLTYGYVKPLTRRPDLLRLNLRAGLAYCTTEIAGNYQLYYSQGGWLSSSGYFYQYDLAQSNSFGIVLAPSLEFTPSLGFGLTTGLFSCINGKQSSFGVNAGILFGKVRSPKKHYRLNSKT